jgi:hypothetical protein
MFPEYELSLKDIVSVGIDGCATQKANFGRKAVIIEEKKN